MVEISKFPGNFQEVNFLSVVSRSPPLAGRACVSSSRASRPHLTEIWDAGQKSAVRRGTVSDVLITGVELGGTQEPPWLVNKGGLASQLASSVRPGGCSCFLRTSHIFRCHYVCSVFDAVVSVVQAAYRTDMSVEAWLDSRGLGSLAEAFLAAGYQDFLVIQVQCQSYPEYMMSENRSITRNT